ncbi:MAG: dTMP kinase [Alphaproteobacteria bacterium]|nr:dTMP kinase [Alphaproteobacteria bacterium]
MKKGFFISLEGGEGAGKSTLAQALITFLQDKDIPAILTREPGGTKEAEAIRSLVVSGDKDRFDPITEALLFNAARRHHLTHRILPALENGTWVICDRFVDSTFVYQGYVQDVDLDFLKKLHCEACDNIFPDLTFLLDVPVDIGLYRANRRQNNINETRFEQKGHDFHEVVRNAFLELAQQQPDRYHVLDSTLSEKDLACAAMNHLTHYVAIL